MFPRLGEPDTKFKDAGEYSVKIRASEEVLRPLLDKLEPLYQAALDQGRTEFEKLPIANRKKLGKVTENPLFNPHYDEDENETGDVTMTFKMLASGVSKKTGKPWSRKPSVFDSKTRPMDGNLVWGGSTGKVAFTTFPHFVKATGAAGLTLRLSAVQVLDLVSGGQRSGESYGFGEEDGYEAEDAASGQGGEAAAGEAHDHTDF